MNILVLHCLVKRISIIRTSIFVTTQMFKNTQAFLRDVKGVLRMSLQDCLFFTLIHSVLFFKVRDNFGKVAYMHVTHEIMRNTWQCSPSLKTLFCDYQGFCI